MRLAVDTSTETASALAPGLSTRTAKPAVFGAAPSVSIEATGAANLETNIALTDVVWLRELLAGDEAAFEALYDRYAGRVYRFALRMCGSPTLADDVTQDVFIALMRKGHLFDASRGALGSYLLGMTRNRVLGLLQREQPYAELAEPDKGDAHETEYVTFADPWLGLAQAERAAAVRHAVLALPLHYREVVILCNLEELSYEQAAAILGCPVGTVRSRLNRARRLLFERLQPAVRAELSGD